MDKMIIKAILPKRNKTAKRWDKMTVEDREAMFKKAGMVDLKWCKKKYDNLPVPIQFLIHEIL